MLLSQIEAFLTVAERRSVSSAGGCPLRDAAGADDADQEARARARDRAVRPHRPRDAPDRGGPSVPSACAAGGAVARSGRELLRELREGRVGELLVGAAPAISTYVLPLVLRRFQTNFPNVHLIVRTGHSEEVLELVLREQVQIGLVRELPHPESSARRSTRTRSSSSSTPATALPRRRRSWCTSSERSG